MVLLIMSHDHTIATSHNYYVCRSSIEDGNELKMRRLMAMARHAGIRHARYYVTRCQHVIILRGEEKSQ